MAQKEITTEYVRQKLGERSKNMTDGQINNILNTLRLLCNKAIDSVVEKNELN